MLKPSIWFNNIYSIQNEHQAPHPTQWGQSLFDVSIVPKVLSKKWGIVGLVASKCSPSTSQTSLTSEGLGGKFWWSLPYAMLFYANSVAMCGLLSSFHHAKATTFSHFAQCLINDDLSCNGVASRKPQGWPYQCTTGYGQLGALLWSSLLLASPSSIISFPHGRVGKLGIDAPNCQFS